MKVVMAGLLMGWMAVQSGAAELNLTNSAVELNWTNNLPAAQKKAKEEKKMVLLDFTGSDWCGWCIVLKREIFDTKEFADYAKTNLVLVEVDFPRNKEQSEQLKKDNLELAQKYGVQGFPTLIILDSEGKPIGQMFYQPGGPQPFITRLSKLKARG